MGRVFRLFFALPFFLVVFAGCSTNSAPRTDPSATSGPDYLTGIRSEYSVPIASLGDADLLGDESVMREALVAGDDALLVAATAFRSEGVLTLDVIVLNDSERTFELTRGDLHLFDADGRLLRQVGDVDAGAAWGLRGRGLRASETAGPGSLFDVTWTMDATRLSSLTPREPRLESDTKKTRADGRSARRDDADDVPRFDSSDAIAGGDARLTGSPTRVRVRPDDGKAFWAYFEDTAPAQPITAMVLIDGEQYLFRFAD